MYGNKVLNVLIVLAIVVALLAMCVGKSEASDATFTFCTYKSIDGGGSYQGWPQIIWWWTETPPGALHYWFTDAGGCIKQPATVGSYIAWTQNYVAGYPKCWLPVGSTSGSFRETGSNGAYTKWVATWAAGCSYK